MGWEGGWGDNPIAFKQGGLAPKAQTLTLSYSVHVQCTLFLSEKVPLSYTFDRPFTVHCASETYSSTVTGEPILLFGF